MAPKRTPGYENFSGQKKKKELMWTMFWYKRCYNPFLIYCGFQKYILQNVRSGFLTQKQEKKKYIQTYVRKLELAQWHASWP